MKKLVVFIALTAFIIWLFPYLSFSYKNSHQEIKWEIEAKAIVLLDADSGKILYEKNGTAPLPIASLTKLMTQYLALNAIQNGSMSWNTFYTPSVEALKVANYSQAVTMGMSAGKQYAVQELFESMTVTSANDAAIAVAELVSGTESSFVELMNKQAKAIGLKETQFYNATGLDGAAPAATNRASARDVAMLAKSLLEKHSNVLDYTMIPYVLTADSAKHWNTNLMLEGMPYALPGIDGLKTGFTHSAGYCFVGTGMFDGRRLISVVLGVDPQDSPEARFVLTRDVIEFFASNNS